MKKLALILALIFSYNVAGAQLTTVTATITDSDSTIWTGAKVYLTFSPTANIPLSAYTINGTPITSTSGPNYAQYLQQAVTTNGSGTMTVTLLDNNVVKPSGSGWYIVVQSNTSATAVTYTPVSVNGTSFSLTSFLSTHSIAPRFPAIQNAFGYTDGEVTPIPPPGGSYFNSAPGTLVGRVWNGTAWQNIGSGGTGNVTAISLTTNTIPKATGTTAIGNSLWTDDATSTKYNGTNIQIGNLGTPNYVQLTTNDANSLAGAQFFSSVPGNGVTVDASGVYSPHYQSNGDIIVGTLLVSGNTTLGSLFNGTSGNPINVFQSGGGTYALNVAGGLEVAGPIYDGTTAGTSGWVMTSAGASSPAHWAAAAGGTPYPSGSGVPIVVTGTSWGTTVAAPSSAFVGISDTQTLTNKSITGAQITSAVANATAATTATTATNLAGGASGSVPYQNSAGATLFVASPTTSGHTFAYGWAPSGSAVIPSAKDLGALPANLPTSSLVDTTSTQTLTGKSIASTEITGLPTFPTGPIVGTTDTQTLTNKTIASSQVTGAFRTPQAVVNFTAQSANIAASTVLTAPATAYYKICGNDTVTRVATTSSTLPIVQVVYTDANDSNLKTANLNTGTPLTLNTVAASQAACAGPYYVLSGSTISAQTTGYTSVGATAMQYDILFSVEVLN